METAEQTENVQGLRAYASIFKTREAYPFDFATLIMRLYMPMITIGMVSMLTLADYSAFFAGSVSSVVAASLFVVSPRVSKLIDERGQSAVVPWAAAIAMAGLSTILAVVHFSLPWWLCYVGAVLMGFSPSPQALARTRWLFLIETGKLGPRPPLVRTVFSYEGVLDDVSFMFGPAISIALAAGITPIAGMVFGGCCYTLGTVLLMLNRSTEPDERWRLANASGEVQKGEKTVLSLFPSVRVLFVLMVLMGATFGVFDTTTVAYTEAIGKPVAASVCLMCAGVVSAFAGFAFGALKFKKATAAQLLLVTAILFGVGYGLMLVIRGVPSLFVVSLVAALTYAPFFISTNNVVERCVPKHRITEALTWIGAGFSCGSAIGPTLGGFFIDFFGATAGFTAGGLFSLAIVPVILLGYRIVAGETRAAERVSADCA